MKHIQLVDTGSYKTGINEVKGLKQVLIKLMRPVQDAVKERVYWSDCELGATEYESRDGFIPYSHNCGGIELRLVIPKCESYEFEFLEFGECDECGKPELGLDRYGNPKQCGYNGDECASESDGHLDAILRVWLKFEGIQDDGSLQFYFYVGGGNGDAPYFRTGREATVFEETLNVKSLAGLVRRGPAIVNRMLKAMQFSREREAS
jgi:hypothetical protein